MKQIFRQYAEFKEDQDGEPIEEEEKKEGDPVSKLPKWMQKKEDHVVYKMSRKGFRDLLGPLALEGNTYLADRIFDCSHHDKNGNLSEHQFIRVLDILMNGT